MEYPVGPVMYPEDRRWVKFPAAADAFNVVDGSRGEVVAAALVLEFELELGRVRNGENENENEAEEVTMLKRNVIV